MGGRFEPESAFFHDTLFRASLSGFVVLSDLHAFLARVLFSAPLRVFSFEKANKSAGQPNTQSSIAFSNLCQVFDLKVIC